MRLALAVAVLMVTATPAEAANRRVHVEPATAGVGATVTVTGSDLARAKVTVGGKRARVISASARRLRVVVPRVKAGRQKLRAGRSAGRLRVVGRFNGRIGVRLRTGRRRSASIGADGGRLVASARGVNYTLAVPAGALAQPTTIVMTPIARITNLPLTGGRRAGVRFGPAGLVFAKPALLTIRRHGRSKKRLVGFTAADDGRSFALVRPGGNRSTATLEIPHFTDFGVSAASEADLALTLSFVVYGTALFTRSEIKQLIEAQEVWEAMFPGFCTRQEALCQMIDERAIAAIIALTESTCRAGKAAPSLQAVRDLADLGANLELLGEDPYEPASSCADDILTLVIEEALKALARAEDPLDPSEVENSLTPGEVQQADIGRTPGVNHIEWLWFLARLGQQRGVNGAADAALNGALDGLERARTLGLERCDLDESAGEAYLRSALSMATSMRYRQDDLNAAVQQCHVHVTVGPGEVTLAPGGQQQFTATVTGDAGTAVTWSASGGTIYEQAIYTAPQTPGTYTVTATSVANPRRLGTATVHVGCAQPVRLFADQCGAEGIELVQRDTTIGTFAAAYGSDGTSDQHSAVLDDETFNPFSQSVAVSASAPGASASGGASQASEIAFDGGQMIVRVAGSYRGAVTETDGGGDGEGNSDFTLEFNVSGADMPFTLSGTLVDPAGADGQTVVSIYGPAGLMSTTTSDTAGSVSAQGTFSAGSYELRVIGQMDADGGESAEGSHDVTLTVG